MINSIKVFPADKTLDDVKESFKWMWQPDANVIIICSLGQNHSLALKSHEHLCNYEFSTWIRFIHLLKRDYDKIEDEMLCVRPFDKDKYSIGKIVHFLNVLGINEITEFDITNERLQDLTKNYNEKF